MLNLGIRQFLMLRGLLTGMIKKENEDCTVDMMKMNVVSIDVKNKATNQVVMKLASKNLKM